MVVRPELLTDGFFDSFETSLGGLDVAETLPPACYTDPDFYTFEKEALFEFHLERCLLTLTHAENDFPAGPTIWHAP